MPTPKLTIKAERQVDVVMLAILEWVSESPKALALRRDAAGFKARPRLLKSVA